MIAIVPNSGILQDDRLDNLRGGAIIAARDHGLPEPVVHYLRAIETAFMHLKYEEKKRWVAEIGWPMPAEGGG